ncbi:MAG: alpha/beta fold hydrolase, partial [Gemmatimonadota bacterium]
PRRVRGLVLVDGAFARETPTREERAWLRDLGGERYRELIDGHWRAILEGSRPDVRSRVLADLRATRRETVVASFRALVDHDPIPAIRRFPGPKLLVLSDIGDIPQAAHRHVEGLPHELVRGTGHWLQMDRPDRFNALLDAFLAHTDLGGDR